MSDLIDKFLDEHVFEEIFNEEQRPVLTWKCISLTRVVDSKRFENSLRYFLALAYPFYQNVFLTLLHIYGPPTASLQVGASVAWDGSRLAEEKRHHSGFRSGVMCPWNGEGPSESPEHWKSLFSFIQGKSLRPLTKMGSSFGRYASILMYICFNTFA